MHSIKTLILFLIVASAQSAMAQSSTQQQIQTIVKTAQKTNKDLDWTAYDKDAPVPVDSLSIARLQGQWTAHHGIVRIEGKIRELTLDSAMIYQFQGDNYKLQWSKTFKKFTLKKNLIQTEDRTGRTYITSLSNKLLVVTYVTGTSMMRYYCEKSAD